MARIQPQWGVALGGGIALRHRDGLSHGEQAQTEHLQRHLRQNLQQVPDRFAARRQNLASSGLPNRQYVHCFILSPRYRWSVESIRLLARATEASVLHAAPAVQPETASPCLTYSMPRNAQVRRHHATWGHAQLRRASLRSFPFPCSQAKRKTHSRPPDLMISMHMNPAGRANNLRFRLITVSHMSNMTRFLHLARSCRRRNPPFVSFRRGFALP